MKGAINNVTVFMKNGPKPGFFSPLKAPDFAPRSCQGTTLGRGAMPRWVWPDCDRENHRAPGSPSLQTVREYGRFSLIIKEF